MNMAIELAKECALQDEVPVGCVVVKDGKVIGASGNRKERENNAICHAEIIALSQATKSVGNWWLEDCDVYVTLEPCVMCAGAMIHSRIRTLYFGCVRLETQPLRARTFQSYRSRRRRSRARSVFSNAVRFFQNEKEKIKRTRLIEICIYRYGGGNSSCLRRFAFGQALSVR